MSEQSRPLRISLQGKKHKVCEDNETIETIMQLSAFSVNLVTVRRNGTHISPLKSFLNSIAKMSWMRRYAEDAFENKKKFNQYILGKTNAVFIKT